MRTGGIDDDTRGVHSEPLLDNRYCDGVEVVAKRLVDLEQECVTLVEELRYAIFVDEHLYSLGQFLVVPDL